MQAAQQTAMHSWRVTDIVGEEHYAQFPHIRSPFKITVCHRLGLSAGYSPPQGPTQMKLINTILHPETSTCLLQLPEAP